MTSPQFVTLVFWSAFALAVYTYAGYPIAIRLLAATRRAPSAPHERAADEWPRVTIVIPVHNERERVLRKIENVRALDYPRDKLEVLFVSDGSTDGTVALLEGMQDVRVLAYATRGGKPVALNRAMATVRTPVVVFADVRQAIEPGAIRRLVARLLEPGIGAVSGELVHIDPSTQAAAQIGLYWRYEKWIRIAESRFDSTVGTTGALYAIRTDHYTPLAPDTVLDDFEQPMLIARRGLRVVIEPGARMFDELQPALDGERRRKVRTLTGNFQSFARHPWMFSPFANRLWFQFVSHKVLRLVVPYALAAMFVSAWFVPGSGMRAVAIAQCAFYAAPILAHALPIARRSRLIAFASVFVELNWASVLAMRNWLFTRVDARWEKT